ncbi:ferredoxin hydrogenase large subunit [Orenia metallireducens]|uniref:Ferredoxin hydrogenase large subunit n=1 Tax=Orenia metallireducens TaxID=1413210 RepID=A0A285GYA4_9FIRM|nr:4Fe-4S dicluster domain-containing protein [Orenia metallireducens]PRX26429.1 ferredoxin hydrogenase large subunit [Orenia metallireducens]SNY28559.1 ferredoxin hydrogenase large subunit [Orenia metallireducens]
MPKNVSEVTKLRRRVFSSIAQLAFEDRLAEDIDKLPEQLIPEQGLGYRCCAHKERAIVNHRIKSALGLEANGDAKNLKKLAIQALELEKITGNNIDVLDIACDRCPLDKYRVSDACRNCVDHSCMNVCPKGAIVIVQNRAYIDQNKCIECGLCQRFCSYNAILKMSRPCETACGIEAITANSDRQAKINYDSCVSCGSCVQACPFGAITYKSQILQTIKMIKDEDTIAILAPAFVGQFGAKIKITQIKQGLKELGFKMIKEVALGADIVTIEESQEFLDKVPNKQNYLTTSCCPAFLALIEQEFSELIENISSTVSPMVALAKVLKEDYPDSKVVFIGPCIAKKDEALKNHELDAVLTFEELGSMFVGAGINLANISEDNNCESANDEVATDDGRTFARSGGLIKAVEGAISQIDPSKEFNKIKAQGLEECIKTLRLAKANQYQNSFIEGMGCQGGCVGGPATLMDTKFTTKQVNNFGEQSNIRYSVDNNEAKAFISRFGSHKFHRE